MRNPIVNPIPPILYKYYPPSRIQSVLWDGALHFTSPTEFNDTFDSNYSIPQGASRFRIIRPQELGVFCVTEEPDNHLMWVNYAAQHTGFVVGYSTCDPVFSMNGAKLKKVNYSDEELPIQRSTDPLPEAAFIKSKDWEYENEWRCVREFKPTESRELNIEHTEILKVIFGWKMEDHHISQILQAIYAIKMHFNHTVEVYKSTPDPKNRSFENIPSNLNLCIECSGWGHVSQ